MAFVRAAMWRRFTWVGCVRRVVGILRRWEEGRGEGMVAVRIANGEVRVKEGHEIYY